MKKVLCLALLGVSLFGCKSMETVIRDYGYTALRPPSTLLEPGSVVLIINTSPFQGSLICNQKESLGTGITVSDSPSSNLEMVSKLQNTFDMDANYLDAIKANAKFEAIKDITLTLKNVSVKEVTETEVSSKVSQRLADCQDVIDNRTKAGWDLTMIKTVIRADVDYVVKFESDNSLTADMKKDILKDLAVTLKVESHVTTDSSIKGSGLFWGVLDDRYLVKV